MTRVVKLGGRTQDSAGLAAAIAAAWAASDGGLCVIHGGGDEITALQRAFGVEPAFVGGRRVTTERDLDFVRMALSGLANKRLVAALRGAGVPACGISGEDASLLVARPLDVARFGHAGTPSRVNDGIVRLLLGGGYLPVISPVATSTEGAGALNVNGDDAAAALAVGLAADELLFVSDVTGVFDGAGDVLVELDTQRARELIASGAVTAGMAAKLEAAEAALNGGVARVRIGGSAALCDAGSGTLITTADAEALA